MPDLQTQITQDNVLVLQEILKDCKTILELTPNYTYDILVKDLNTAELVLQNLLSINKNVQSLPKELKEAVENIILLMMIPRNKQGEVITKDDICKIWDIIEFDIPQLKDYIEKLI